MKSKEITIYDNYYSLEYEQEVREVLFDEYADEKGWQTPEDIPEECVFDEMEFQDSALWDDVKAELSSLFAGNMYLLVGTCGRWTGPSEGGRFIRSVDDLLSCIDHLDYIRIFDRGGHLYIHGSHHDGNDDYELKRLTRKGVEYADRNYYAHDRHLHNIIMRNNFFSALPHFTKRIYGV